MTLPFTFIFEGKKVIRPSDDVIDNMSINEYLECIFDPKDIFHNRYEWLNEYYAGRIPDDVIYKFKHNPHYDFVNENLMTHSTDLLISKMYKSFPLFDIECNKRNENGDSFVDAFFYYKSDEQKEIIYNFLNSDRFKRFLDFFGYSLSNIKDNINDMKYHVYIEPVYFENKEANKLVYDDCHGIIYHITNIFDGDKIEQTGLRMRGETSIENRKPRYRDYPNRVYFLAIPKCKDIIHSDVMQNAILSYLDETDIKNGFCIFKVDVNRFNIDFYMDSCADENAVFCYDNIPKEQLKLLYKGNFDDLFLR